MKHIALTLFICCTALWSYGQKEYELKSPDGNIHLTVTLSDNIAYDVACGENLLAENCLIGMELADQSKPGAQPRLLKAERKTVDRTIRPVVPFKFSAIRDNYNQLVLKFKGDYSVEFRAYDDGVAHRFVTGKKGEIDVVDESFQIDFPGQYILHGQQPGGFKTGYEEEYRSLKSAEYRADERMVLLPLLIDTQKGYKILISESDLTDYPALFFKSTGSNGLTAEFPKVPTAFGFDGDRSLKIEQEAGYIARTDGTRGFPWRYMVICKEDGQLIENTMTCKLSPDNALDDTSWIKPGVASWEWWNGWTPYGPDVNFVTGQNTDTYKYFIDFASRYGISYIVMDEGWARRTEEPFSPNPNVDVHELIRYGKEKNVGIVLWLTWLSVENNPTLFETFEKWGVKGLKIDFMDRSDQWMVRWYEKVAKEAAKHHLFVDFHGSFKPAGLEYKYPNILSYEGVRGMEQMGGCTPDNSVWMPFIRNAVGPMDYTPGAMLSMQPEVYMSNRPNSASIGTRAYQMALFVIFETGIQMMADNPTLYYNNDECTRFMTEVPLTWDETIALEAEAGQYAVVAKRKGDKWYIGGMTNNGMQQREFDLNLSFLEDGQTYKLTAFEDGINANRQAMDYRKTGRILKKGDKFHIRMARNGGFAGVIEVVK